MIDTGNPVPRQTNTQLGAELNGFIELAPDDRAHMGLVDADNAGITPSGAAIKHLFLLKIHMLNNPILPQESVGQGDYPAPNPVQQGFKLYNQFKISISMTYNF